MAAGLGTLGDHPVDAALGQLDCLSYRRRARKDLAAGLADRRQAVSEGSPKWKLATAGRISSSAAS
jgi:hypothetical protein